MRLFERKRLFAILIHTNTLIIIMIRQYEDDMKV
ncbi:Uncharacterised protein [Enterobacter hormaechei]|nr:Uncharacterised protein [Enterobacter hormaechei]